MKTLLLAVAGLGLAACVGAGDDEDITELDLEEDTQAATTQNGTSVNGTSINGTSINGTSISSITVTAGQLTGKNSSNVTISGTQLVGAKLTGTTNTGASVTLRIDSAQAIKVDQWAYGVSVQNGTSWVPLCGTSTTLAYAISGTWDYRTGVAGAGGPIADSTKFTWACRGQGAIAKCIDLGYAPWRTVSGTLLKNHHTACVRMIRGDYCGDGTAYTTNGQTINVYDKLGIQLDTQNWAVDAEWGTTGARCTKRTRTFSSPPPCFEAKVTSTCGTFASTSTLLIDEYSAVTQ